MGEYIGEYVGVIKEDTRSLDIGSNAPKKPGRSAADSAPKQQIDQGRFFPK